MEKDILEKIEKAKEKIIEDILEEDDLTKLELLEKKEKILRELLKESKKKRMISESLLNTIIVSSTSLISILLMLNYERFDVFTSKAMGLLIRNKV